MIIFKQRYKDVHPESDRMDHITIHAAVNPKFQVGDCVEIIDGGKHYSNYKTMAVALCLHALKSIESYDSDIKGNFGTIVGIARHGDGNCNICAVREPDGNSFLIGESGLKLVRKQKYLDDKLFEI
jgi:hypothetical protein